MPKQDVLLIHGTWGHGGSWDDFAAALNERGYRAHSPTLPAHGLAQEIDVWSAAQEVAKLGIDDYVDHLRGLVDQMETAPIIVGHSLGGLLAQVLAQQVRNSGVMLIGTAPAAGVFALYPSTTYLWGRYAFKFFLGGPMFPIDKKAWDRYICNTVPQAMSDEWYAGLCAESGTVYRQMALWFTDPKQRARVHFDKITTPVLVVAGEQDKCCPPAMNKATAERYGDRGTYAEIPGSDHMMIAGPAMPHTLEIFDDWTARHGLAAAQKAANK